VAVLARAGTLLAHWTQPREAFVKLPKPYRECFWDSDRQVLIDPGTVEILRTWRKAQLAERIAWGPAWTDSGRVFTREDGTPLRPGWISTRFGILTARAGLPPIRFHDLRHGTATMLLAAGQPIKVISDILGHATSAFTADVYTEVAEELADAGVAAIAAIIPRHESWAKEGDHG
jgi:integrase